MLWLAHRYRVACSLTQSGLFQFVPALRAALDEEYLSEVDSIVRGYGSVAIDAQDMLGQLRRLYQARYERCEPATAVILSGV